MHIARIIDQHERETLALRAPDGELVRAVGDLLASTLISTGEAVTPLRFLPPVEPRAIVCVGLNYRRHAEETSAPIPEHPVIFMKNPAAATGHAAVVTIPAVVGDEVDYEGELAMVIAKPCRDVSEEDALEYLAGFTVANDVSARVWQKGGGGQWVRGKSFDSFAPMGPFLVTPDEVPHPNRLALVTRLNGQVVQESNTADMIFTVRHLISFISQGTTLLPGTVILTGTPEGVGWARTPRLTVKAGDRVEIEIEGIGKLENEFAR